MGCKSGNKQNKASKPEGSAIWKSPLRHGARVELGKIILLFKWNPFVCKNWNSWKCPILLALHPQTVVRHYFQCVPRGYFFRYCYVNAHFKRNIPNKNHREKYYKINIAIIQSYQVSHFAVSSLDFLKKMLFNVLWVSELTSFVW